MATNPILERIAARLGRTPLTGNALEERFRTLRDGVEPGVDPFPGEEPEALFRRQAEQNLFELSAAPDPRALIPGLADQPLPLVLSPQAAIRALPWGEHGLTMGEDCRRPALGVVAARVGIAESGSVAVDSRSATVSLLYLAEELMVILERERIFKTLDALEPGADRRAHYLISGPSRTADVEQTLQVGAHGPRRVYLWLVDRLAGI